MTAQKMTRVVAGFSILFSLVMAHLGSQVNLMQISWLWFTAFVGINLFQSGLTGWCLMTNILGKIGFRSA